MLWRDSDKARSPYKDFYASGILSSSIVPVIHTHKIHGTLSLTIPSERVTKRFLFHICREWGHGQT